jgi:hypothetical protein
LPQGYSLPRSTNAIVGGWGKNEGDEFSQVFKFATAHVFSSAECNEFAGAGYTRNDGTQFCIGYEQGGIDTCQVKIVKVRKDNNGIFRVIREDQL